MLFTVRSLDEAGNTIREIGCDLAKDAMATMDREMRNGAYRTEAFNNHYRLVQFLRHSNRVLGG